MLGRGIDQILPNPGDDRIYESYMTSASDYVRLAEKASGKIPRGVGLGYVWGDAAEVLAQSRPDFGLVNLETAVTDCGRPEPKGINYRMSTANAESLSQLGIGCCALANNHVLDWGPDGLNQTIATLHHLGIATAGAGRDLQAAARPAILQSAGQRLLVFAFATGDSGVPRGWEATSSTPGIHRLAGLDSKSLATIRRLVAQYKKRGDIAVASIHWGDNWGYKVAETHQFFARGLIDVAGIDLVHGHSSHHPKGWEIHNGNLILYGCGDLINDYEGIAGVEKYRSDIVAIYLADIDPATDARLTALSIVPMHIRNFRLSRASDEELQWLCRVLNLHGAANGARLAASSRGTIDLVWD
ncbi:MAG: CapA family protein [Alphaproteobacteria bacterium]|nr:CapA family protein [Alphaproteobacteria bacterium]